MPRADVAVVGLGAAGSAILEALASRGIPAVGLDQYAPPHTLGSTHGRSRVIREAYYESPVYVPLVQRAYREWERLARESGRHLLTVTGGVMIGPRGSTLVEGARTSAVTHGLPHEMLTAAEVRKRFPVFAVSDADVGVAEPRAGFLDPEACVTACLELAARKGAEIRTGVRVTGWSRRGDAIRLETGAGPLEAGRVVFAAGPWLPSLLPAGALPLEIERQVMYWFTPLRNAGAFAAARCPVFIWEHAPGRMFYGIPDHGFGFKTAIHHEGARVSPDQVERTVQADDVATIRELLARAIPDAPGALRESAVCLYTNTPDHHFLLGPHPEEPRVYLASPCSGHGFKFASAIGAVVAGSLQGEAGPLDLTPFSPARF